MITDNTTSIYRSDQTLSTGTRLAIYIAQIELVKLRIGQHGINEAVIERLN